MPTSASFRIAVYTGVFDPVHLGHLTSSAAAASCSIGWSSASASTRTRRRSSRLEERVELLQQVTEPIRQRGGASRSSGWRCTSCAKWGPA